MGEGLILDRNHVTKKKTFTDIKLTEANSLGYGGGTSDLTWTATEACTIVLSTAKDGTSNLVGSYTITGTYTVLYESTNSSDTTEKGRRCAIIEVQSGCKVTFKTSSSDYKLGRSIVKIPLTKLEITKLNFSNHAVSGDGTYVTASSGTGAGLSYKKDHAYLCVGELGYHDLTDPQTVGVSVSQTNCTYSSLTRGNGTKSSSHNATLASSPASNSWSWSALGCAIFIPTADSGCSFNLNPYVNKSYDGAWASTWTFEIWQKRY